MKKLLPLVLLFALSLTGCAAPIPAKNTYRRVSMDEAMELMETEKDYLILDVRTAEEYAVGHIPNALLLPNETIGTEPISLLPDKDQLILVYCRSGNRSRQAAEKLAKLGYTNIVEFGGIISWPGEIVTD